jgi:hypothetical protein
VVCFAFAIPMHAGAVEIQSLNPSFITPISMRNFVIFNISVHVISHMCTCRIVHVNVYTQMCTRKCVHVDACT